MICFKKFDCCVKHRRVLEWMVKIMRISKYDFITCNPRTDGSYSKNIENLNKSKTRQETLDIIEKHEQIIRDPTSNINKVKSSKLAIKALEDDLGKLSDNNFGVRRIHKSLDVSTLENKASQGDAQAQCILGDLCADYGNTHYFDVEKAFYWYTKAAEQGHTRAQWQLGASYGQGIGVEKDEAKAEYWCLKSAHNGDADGQLALGYIYSMKSDLVKAEYWMEKAADQGHPEAIADLRALRSLLNKSPRRIAPPDLINTGMWEWKKCTHTSLKGNLSAKDLYENGNGFLRNREIEKGIKLLEKAVSLYNPDIDDYALKSLCDLALFHETGMHPHSSIVEAIKMYKYLAQKPRCSLEKLRLGLLYLEGFKTQHRPEEGLALIREALPVLEVNSMVTGYDYERLGQIFFSSMHTYNGRLDKESVKEAIYYLDKAVAKNRDANDQRALESARDLLERAKDRLKTMNSW